MITKRGKLINIAIAVSIVVVTCVLFALTWRYEKTVDISFKGVEFKAGEPSAFASSSIIAKGKSYKKGLFGKIQFEGEIIVDGVSCDNSNGEKLFIFNKSNAACISNNRFEGLMYADKNFKEITIMIYGENGKLYESRNLKSGIYISAPCTNREDAVRIANKLLEKDYTNIGLE